MTLLHPPRNPHALCVFAAVLTACGGGDSSRQTSSQRAACEARADGSRWASAAAYRETGSVGRGEQDWLSEAGGVAVHDSLVFVYDPPEGRVRVLTEALVPVREFGARGGGPGEMRQHVSRGMSGPQWQWLALAGDTLLVFDGTAVHRFSTDGRFLGRAYDQAVHRTDLNDGSAAIVSRGGRLLSSWGGYYLSVLRPPGDRYRWSILGHSASGRPDTLLSLRLEPLPQVPGGAGFAGPAQARPVWGASEHCIVATDGGGGWIVRASLSGQGLDTLTFQLPDVAPPPIDKEEVGRLAGMVGKGKGGYLEPSREQRVSSLVVDPDGYAWILPVQDTAASPAGLMIVRVSLATGQATQDTVPAFPLVFGRPGVFYARKLNPTSGESEVVRYEAPAGEAP
jgi:hypothetical protein